MAEKRDLYIEFEQLNVLKNLVRAYEEIASIRMKKSRDTVLYTRQYLGAISEIFDEVRYSYQEEAKGLVRRKGKSKKKLTFLAHNGRKVAVLLSANTGLYGDIVTKTFDKFMDEVLSSDVEVVIVGRYGLSLFLGSLPDHPYTFFEMSDGEEVRFSDFSNIVKHIVNYEEIHVYYGKYISVIKQEPVSLSISAEISFSDKGEKKNSYIFEPSLEEILIFFETEIFASLFEQSVRESQLAKFASRVLAMNRAEENIKQKVKALELTRLKLNHDRFNRKQLNSLSTVILGL